jgi:mannose-6-phosphate isomerase-like protein (cupin superfamily)
VSEDYTVAAREDAPDFMAEYPGFGEMRNYTDSLDCEQVAFSWRLMPENTGGRGSYGHRHRTQEEVVFVVSGKVTFKVGDDVFEGERGTAVRIAPSAVRSLHNDGPGEAEILIFSPKAAEGAGAGAGDEVEKVEDFWPGNSD